MVINLKQLEKEILEGFEKETDSCKDCNFYHGVTKKKLLSLIRKTVKQVVKSVPVDEEKSYYCPSPEIPCLCNCHRKNEECYDCLHGSHKPNCNLLIDKIKQWKRGLRDEYP